MLWPLRILLSALRMILFFVGTFFTISAFVIHKKLTGELRGAAWFHRMCTMTFGIRIHRVGEPAGTDGRVILYTPNHVSYIDIGVMGQMLRNSVFVAKGEISGWPLFGWLATLQDTVFIRRVRTAMEAALAEVTEQVALGRNVILYPEGTTGDGSGVLPFKAGLFELAYAPSPHGKLLVQPVAIVIDRIDGKPAVTQKLRDYYAWWRKEDTLLPHMMKVGSRFYVDISVHFLAPLDPADYPARKDLAQAAEDAVRAVVEACAKAR